jgi:dephospho-CoA kinase
MLKVGISGKIAAGKSEVENILQNLGYKVFDLDKLSHQLLEDNKIKAQILAEFKTTDRKELGNIVFNDEAEKQKLENIIYPKLKEIILELFEENKEEKVIFISGALLFKSGFSKLFDKTIFIDADDKIRLERLMKRNNLSIEVAKSRLNLQDDKNSADFIIKNNSDIKNLEKEIKNIIKKLPN